MKNRVNFTLDEDVVAWLRLAYKDGEKSSMVNDYFRFLMNKVPSDDEQKLEELQNQFDKLKIKNAEIIKEMSYVNSQIQLILQKEDKETDEMVKKLEGEADAMIRSGAWADLAER